jgi:hypothetical protein
MGAKHRFKLFAQPLVHLNVLIWRYIWIFQTLLADSQKIILILRSDQRGVCLL